VELAVGLPVPAGETLTLASGNRAEAMNLQRVPNATGESIVKMEPHARVTDRSR